jgi:hypothetical protein
MDTASAKSNPLNRSRRALSADSVAMHGAPRLLRIFSLAKSRATGQTPNFGGSWSLALRRSWSIALRPSAVWARRRGKDPDDRLIDP